MEKIEKEDTTEEYKCKSENWMSIDYVERVLDHRSLSNGEYVVKVKQDERLKCETDLKSTMPVHLDSFTFSNSEKIMKNFLHEIDGFLTNYV